MLFDSDAVVQNYDYELIKVAEPLLTAKGCELMEYKHQRRVLTIELGAQDTNYVLIVQMIKRSYGIGPYRV